MKRLPFCLYCWSYRCHCETWQWWLAVGLVLLLTTAAHAQTVIQPGQAFTVTAVAHAGPGGTGAVVSPLPVGGSISWWTGGPNGEIVVQQPSPSASVFHGIGKTSLFNTAPLLGTITANYQDSFGVVSQTIAFALAPAPPPPTAPPTPIPPTAVPAAPVKSLVLTFGS